MQPGEAESPRKWIEIARFHSMLPSPEDISLRVNIRKENPRQGNDGQNGNKEGPRQDSNTDQVLPA